MSGGGGSRPTGIGSGGIPTGGGGSMWGQGLDWRYHTNVDIPIPTHGNLCNYLAPDIIREDLRSCMTL